MLFLEVLQHIQLLRLIARRLPQLLLSLIIHHLLDHAPRLAVQIPQLTTLRRDLRNIDLRRPDYHMRPPFHLVDLVEVDVDCLRAVGRGDQRPC
jgi:hypothetical protein